MTAATKMADFLRRAREPGAASDPVLFDLKAEAFEIAAETDNPYFGEREREEAREIARMARRRAAELRGSVP